MDPQISRPQFYEGEYLGAADLEAGVEYARDGLSRHALGAHVWGIAIGMELVERSFPNGQIELLLSPGFAWDGYGRSLVALSPRVLSLNEFVNFQDTTDPAGIPVQVWIRFREL